MDSSTIVTAAVGLVQGFVGLAATAGLSRKFGVLIISVSRQTYNALQADARPTVSEWVATGISFVALVLLQLVVGIVVVDFLTQHQGGAIREYFGRTWSFGVVAGLVLSRLLPEFEARLRAKGNGR